MAAWSDAILAPGARRGIAALLREHLPANDGRPTLDVGCGARPRILTAGLVGIDRDHTAVTAYARRAPCSAADAANLPFATGAFAASFSVGLLHHLPETQARTALLEMLRVTAPCGTIVVFDGIRPLRGRPIAALIRTLDRGAHMRTRAGLGELLDGVATWTQSVVTYAATGLEGLLAVHVKADG